MGGFFGKPRQDRRAATAASAREGSVAGLTARAFESARPRRPAKKDLWSSSAAARASRSYLCVLSAVYISWARMVWTCVDVGDQNNCKMPFLTPGNTSSFTFALQWL